MALGPVQTGPEIKNMFYIVAGNNGPGTCGRRQQEKLRVIPWESRIQRFRGRLHSQ